MRERAVRDFDVTAPLRFFYPSRERHPKDCDACLGREARVRFADTALAQFCVGRDFADRRVQATIPVVRSARLINQLLTSQKANVFNLLALRNLPPPFDLDRASKGEHS